MKNACIIFFLFFSSSSFSQHLVLPGDFPDPSVVKIGDTYWASATTSNWAPAFPLFRSKDLHTWQLTGHAFETLPSWADYYFWAPEISYENGKVYLYYTAHKRGGNLCVGIASADKPEGPYRDHGPVMCQEAGSIDGFPMRDENGELYLIWKEDGNSIDKPTPIWAMQLNEDRTQLIGDKKELFRNETPWEANLVEGVSMIKHGEYFYAFYAAAGCCGPGCSYGIGVARSKNLLGPWEKHPKNPIASSTAEWKCLGHGTPVEHNGRYYFLYHGYDRKSGVYTGRQGLLSEFIFTDNGWVEFRNNVKPQANIPAELKDEFDDDFLSPQWQWSVFQKVNYNLKKGILELYASPQKSGTFVCQKNFTTNYVAEVTLLFPFSAEAGIGLIGDEENFISATIKHNILIIRAVEKNKETIVSETKIAASKQLDLRLTVKDGKDVTFEYKPSGGKFTQVNNTPVDGFFLPPWDRAVRVGLISRGTPDEKARFDQFVLRNGH